MFEALPVVIPTLRDVTRGTLRPAGAEGVPELGNGRTAVILLDAAAPNAAGLRALYDELELYLQAAHISALRLHRRQQSIAQQMFDILASVSLLRSHGSERVILVVAAHGDIPPWAETRAETLTALLNLIRRHHAGSAHELVTAIEDMVKTIRVVADSVVGVATLLLGAPQPTLRPLPASWTGPSRPYALPLVMDSASSTDPSSARPPMRALALALPHGGYTAQEQARAVSQIYLWCRSLAPHESTALPAPNHAPWPQDTAAVGVEPRESARVVSRAHEAVAEFRGALERLEVQWGALASEMRPETAYAAAPQTPDEQSHETVFAASRAAWTHLDCATRLKWLELCRQSYSHTPGLPSALRYVG